jgi:ubiquinone/menaquinone biosynthesis C-methylase UbiE
MLRDLRADCDLHFDDPDVKCNKLYRTDGRLPAPFAVDAPLPHNPANLGGMAEHQLSDLPTGVFCHLAQQYSRTMGAERDLPLYPVRVGVPGEIVSTREGYDRWAEIYDDVGNPLLALEEPELALMLGNVRGLRIADIGTGTGRHAIRFANAGAQVVALDFSRRMLAKACAKPGAGTVSFIVADCAATLPLRSGAFDRVVCALLADHVFSLDSLMSELARVCSRDGFIALTTVHPTMHLLGVHARFNDPELSAKIYPKSYDHMISTFVMAAGRAGLRFDTMTEHLITEELTRTQPRSAPMVGWPLLLAMKLSHA